MQRRRPGRHEEGNAKSGGKGFRGIQIFVKMDDSKAVTMDAAPSDKVSDVMRRISVCDSKRDMSVTFEGRVLRKSDELRVRWRRSAGHSRMRGGGRQKDKKSKAESPKKPEQKPGQEVGAEHRQVRVGVSN